MNQEDQQAREIVRQARPLAAGSPFVAGSAGSVSQPRAATSTRIDAQGRVRRLFLMGDPWSDDYYFKQWRDDRG